MTASPQPADEATGQAGPAAGDGPPVAAIDIGSGKAKLLVTDLAGLQAGGRPLEQHAIKTDLLTADGKLADHWATAIGHALDEFEPILDRHGPAALTVAATEWARQAGADDELAALIDGRLGSRLGGRPVEVLSGRREAELSYRGATRGRGLTGPVAVIDIGAGSTEFAFGEGDVCHGAVSLEVGGRMLCDRYIESDPPRASELSSALSVVELYLDDLRRELPGFREAVEADGVTIVGGGAMQPIAEVEIGVADPEAESVDGYGMTKEALEEVFRALATESIEDRAFNPGLRPEDVEDIVGAMCLAVEFMRQFAVDEVLVSSRGVGAGLVAELIDGLAR
jgi:exopolyphosphatase/guanosine-5'-triphosphate,3'-diphosphate pyrophosphatase